MDNDILATPAELLRCASEIRAAHAIYKDAVQKAQNAADDVTGKWKGTARDAFAQEQQKAYKEHSLLLNSILTLTAELEKTARRYIEIEQSVRRTIQ